MPKTAVHQPLLRCAALISIVLCAAATVAKSEEALSVAQVSAIERAGSAAVVEDGLPGLSISIARRERIRNFAFGKADVENEVAVTADSMFRTASISKWMTATAALRLVEDGKLNLDAPLQQYCPQYPKKEWTITARLLLSHLSGTRHYHGANGEPRATEEQRRRLAELTRREQSTQYTRYADVLSPLASFKDDPLVFQPGARFLYTSLGYRVLACVLEGAAQKPYRTLMHELVFMPAGMKTITEDDALAIIPHRVAGYAKENATLVRAQFRDVSENLPAGGHLATTMDLIRFATAFNAGKLVQPATRDLMSKRPQLTDGSSAPFAPPFFGLGSSAYYGMGVFVGSLNDEPLVMHSGSQPGTSTELLLAPTKDVAVAIMSNMNGWTGAHSLAMQILESLDKE